VLPAWEQAYLKEIILGDRPHVSFAAACYGAFDGADQPYHSNHESYLPCSSPTTMQQASPGANSILFGIKGLKLSSARSSSTLAASHSVDANIGEGSGPNKRPHMEEHSLPQ